MSMADVARGLANKKAEAANTASAPEAAPAAAAPAPAPAAGKSAEEVAKEVVQGKWGVGQERVKKLTDAGYDAAAVQKIVNELMKK